MINVLLAGDVNVFHGICLNALSIAKYTKTPVTIHVMTEKVKWQKSDKISYESVMHLRDVMKSFNPENDVKYYDLTEDIERDFFNSPNMNPAYSVATLLRLYLHKYIDCDRLIYLDADTMTCNSLEEFTKIDISNYEMGVVHDYLGKFWIKKDYFNAGVLYINVNRIKETDCFAKAIKVLKEKKLYFSDQSALYMTVKEKLYLDSRFNEQRKIKKDTVVKHFCKAIRYLPYFKVYNYKQWNVRKVHNFLHITMFDDIYKQYEELFPNERKLDY